jgi:transcription elongation factor Elf1
MNLLGRLLGREEVPGALCQEWCCGFTVHCPHCEAKQLSDQTLAVIVGQANGTYACTKCGKKFGVNVSRKFA